MGIEHDNRDKAISQNGWLRSLEGRSLSAEVKVVVVAVAVVEVMMSRWCAQVVEPARNKLRPPATYLGESEGKSAYAGYDTYMMTILSPV